ncbi:hypothetical protein PENTCL1PPCAC_23325, partial [Pristionchus entomophagus]
VHCNACQDAPSKENNSFWFTNCMHIYCKKCVQKLRVSSTKQVMCVHCKKHCNLIEIGANMPPKVKRLFTPVEKVIKEQQELLKRVLKFQADQLDSMVGFAKKEKDMLMKAIKMNQQANVKIQTITKEKEELVGSVEYHRKRLEQFERHIKDLQSQVKSYPSNAILTGGGADFFNMTSQSDPINYTGIDHSMQSEMNKSMDSSFSRFMNGGQFSGHAAPPRSEPSTPICSQLSGLSDVTTPKILGLPKKGTAVGGGGVRSDNPYMAMWNRTSVDRQKRTTGGGANRNRSTEGSSEVNRDDSPMRRTPGRKGYGSGFPG